MKDLVNGTTNKRMQQYYRASAMKESPCGSRKRTSITIRLHTIWSSRRTEKRYQ